VGEENTDPFDLMEGIGAGVTRAIIYAVAIIAYLSRRDFFLGLLANDQYALGFSEGMGLTILIFGQITQRLRTLVIIWNNFTNNER
jgi:hypothetical protein